MYTSYGDRNFFDHGILVQTGNPSNEVELIRCLPYYDEEDCYMFGHMVVDTEDDWIEKRSVMDYAGMKDFDPVMYAIACTDFYNWENFGVIDYSGHYDWRKVNKETILNELKDYDIDYEGMDDPFDTEVSYGLEV